MAEGHSNMACWSFKGNNPWLQDSGTEWVPYRDIEMQIIEEAYQQGKLEVLLDNYRIDLKEFLQFKRTDASKQRPVRRRLGDNQQECLREARFYSTPPHSSPPPSSYGKASAWCPFLTEWLKLPAGKKAVLNFPSAIDACIDGIREEAARHQSNSITEAQWMIEQLQACKTKARRETSRVCIHLYTRESFLYLVLNKALRDTDVSKLDTLGPLCFLVRDSSRTCSEFVGTVYRGVEMPMAAILSYQKAIGTWRSWPSYTSTSKNREMAEIRGDTLFVIEITKAKLSCPRAYDLVGISQFPSEEEVLLPAGTCFQVVSVEQDSSKKYIISIQL